MPDTLIQNIRYTFRWLRRAPGVALIAIGSFAIGIGFAVFAFNLVQQAVSYNRIPAQRSGRLVDIFTSQLDGSPYGTNSFPDLEELRAGTRVFDELVVYSPIAAAVRIDAAPRMAVGEAVSGNYFQVFNVSTQLGRALTSSDDRHGASRVVVLSEGLWRRQFGASASVLGRVLRIRNQPYTIVGVAAHGFSGAAILPVDFWMPLTWADDGDPVGIIETVPSPGTSQLEHRGSRWLFARGRLAPGQTVASARTATQVVMARLEKEYPATNAKRRFAVLDSRNVRIHPAIDFAIAPASAALAAVVLLLLAVVCANVSGLLLARGAARRREIAIRFALGASRRRVVAQLLTESVVVAVIAGSLAIGLLWTLAAAARGFTADIGVPLNVEPRIGTPSLWFGLGLALAAGIVAGLAPALRATERSRLFALTSSSTSATSGRQRWTLRDGLIVVQTAAAFVLLVTAGLLMRSTVASRHLDVGFRTDRVIAISTGTGVLGYDAARADQFYSNALARLRAIPGVEAAALVGRVPFDLSFWRETIYLSDGRSAPTGRTEYATSVSDEYFGVLDISIIEGRHFTRFDTPASPPVVIVSRAFAEKYFPGGSAVGKRFHARTPDGPEYEIVGVSADYMVARIGEPPTPYIQYAVTQSPANEWQILVRSVAGVATPIDQIGRELRDLDAGLLLDMHALSDRVARVLAPLQVTAVGLSSVGIMTILFAAVGLYGVISFMVARRTQEFGIRMAIGAAPFQVWSAVIKRGLMVAAVGMTLGSVLAAAAAGALVRLLYGVRGFDPVAWGIAFFVVAGIALMAHALPARRAASINPAQALRAE